MQTGNDGATQREGVTPLLAAVKAVCTVCQREPLHTFLLAGLGASRDTRAGLGAS